MQTFPNCQVVRPVGVSFLGHPTFFLYWRVTEEKQTTQQTMHYCNDSFSHKLLTPVDTEELQMHIQVHNMKLKKGATFFLSNTHTVNQTWTFVLHT